MRVMFAITAAMLLPASGFAVAQDASDTVKLPLVPAEPLAPVAPAEDVSSAATIPSHGSTCSSCSSQPVSSCSNSCCTTRRVIAKRYYWVPAATVGVHSRVVASRYVTRTVSGVHAEGLFTGGCHVPAYSQYSAGCATTGCGTNLSTGFVSGGVGVRSFAPVTTGVLPASPYPYHPSYDVYSQGAFTQSYGGYGYGTGVVGAGYAVQPVYPTVHFRRTNRVVNPIPAPHYAAY